MYRPCWYILYLHWTDYLKNGALAVQDGRDITPTVNQLLSFPFVLKIATKDWHPKSHISFAANHDDKQPFTDYVSIVNPSNPEETYKARLWPVHCVQGTTGAELVPELDVDKVDGIIEKGQNENVEMYSPFFDPFQTPRGCDSGLSKMLKDKNITDVFVVGLAADYCVLNCATDAFKEGFNTFIVEEGTRAVDPDGWPKTRQGLQEQGIQIVSMDSEHVQRLNPSYETKA